MRARWVLGAVLFMFVAAACGSGGNDGEELVVGTPAAVASAASASLDAGTAHFTFTMTMDMNGAGLNEPVTITGEGAQDFAQHTGEFTMDWASMFEQLGGDAMPSGMMDAFSADPMRFVLQGTDEYMCGGFVAALMSGGADCLHLDLADILGEEAASQALGSNADPTAILGMLEGAGSVETVGTDDVDGVATTHLRGTLTLQQALEHSSVDLEDAFDRIGVDDATLDTPIDFDVWVGNDDGLVYRITETLTSMPAAAGLSGDVTFDMTFSDYGEPVDIVIPTDFVEAADLPGFGSMLGGG